MQDVVVYRGKKRSRMRAGFAPSRLFGVRRRRVIIPRPLRGAVRVGGYYGRYAGSGRGELKFFDTKKNFVAVAETGTILSLSLNLIPQGVTESERVGRKCTIKKIDIRGTFFANKVTDSSNTKNGIRIIVYVDQQANGATAAVADILEDITATNGYTSFYNLANQGRFRVLYDKARTIRASAVAQTAAGTFSTYLEQYDWRFAKTCNIPVEFSGVTGAIGEIRSNNIGVLAICGDSDGPPDVQYTARVRFSDS